MDTLRFGILSTAGIAASGFIPFVERVPGVKLVAVSSRAAARAAEFAAQHDIPRSYGSYDEMLEDGDIDCVYNPLPASMHAEWSIRALEAGKHVLCEKPLTVNAAEAMEIKAKVDETGLIFAEAFHNRYHPVIQECLDIAHSGEIGEVRSVQASFCIVLTDFKKVQYKKEMGGGALLDLGCYPVSFCRWVAGCDDVEVTRAGEIRVPGGGVDLLTWAKIKFDNGVKARIRCSLVHMEPQVAVIRGTRGVISLLQFIHPVLEHGDRKIGAYILAVAGKSGVRSVRVESSRTYEHQLDAFCQAVRSGEQPVTNIDEAVANMRLLDAISEKAGA